MRATPRADRDGRSPFEIITGLKPQGPLNRVFDRVRDVTLAANDYVKDLTKHLERVQQGVEAYLSADYEKKELCA